MTYQLDNRIYNVAMKNINDIIKGKKATTYKIWINICDWFDRIVEFFNPSYWYSYPISLLFRNNGIQFPFTASRKILLLDNYIN